MSPGFDTFTDGILATAIVSKGGSVTLLVPVFSEQCRNLDLLDIFSLVEDVSQDPRYAQAFAFGARSERPGGITAPPKPRSSIIARLRCHSDALGLKLTNWIASRFPPSRTPAVPEITVPAPTSRDVSDDSELPTIISTPVRVVGMNSSACSYEMAINVKCCDGVLIDAQGCARGRCPLCGVGRA